MEKEQQQKYLQLQLISQQMQQIDSQIQLVDSQIQQLQSLKASVAELPSIKDSEAFSSIGSGVFIKTKTQPVNSVLVNIGAKMFVEKSINDARETIEKQITISTNYLNQMNASLQMLEQQALHLQHELA